MKLIGNNSSPYVRKVRVVLAEKRLDYQYVLENPWSSESKIGAANPLGKVPCLVLEGGEALFDSRVIVEYVDTLSPLGKLIPGAGRERAEVKTWEALGDGLLDAAVAARMERHWPLRPPEQQSALWVERHVEKILSALEAMDAGLGEKTYCGGVHPNLADISVGCALGYLNFRFPQIDWPLKHPNLGRLYERLMQRQSFRDTQPS